jgi:L-2,4-diaminobutyrate decarboxylase
MGSHDLPPSTPVDSDGHLGGGLDRGFDAESFRALAHHVVDRLADHLGRTLAGAEARVLPAATPEQLLAHWPADFPMSGHPDVTALDRLLEPLLQGSIHLHNPRYMGHQVTPPLPFAAIAELCAQLLNNSMAVSEMGPAATAIEHNLVAWMAALLGWPAGAGGVFTSGGSAANLTALLTARQVKAPFDAWQDGLCGREPLAVLVSEQAHYSIDRAVRILGLGAGGAVTVGCDEQFRMRAADLPAALGRAGARRVFAVVASACSTATGAFDPLPAIADFCAAHDLWLHVDGAHGASAVLSPRHRALLDGIERADSVVWDAHKLMLMPGLATALIYRDGRHAYQTFAQRAPYLFAGGPEQAPADEWWTVGLRTLECTKRMMALPLYLSLRLYGVAPFCEQVERSFALAVELARLVTAAPDFELGHVPQANIVCFRYRPAGAAAGAGLDALQSTVRQRILARGRFYVVQARLPSGTFLRVTLLHPGTKSVDLAALLEEIRAVAA